MEGDEQGREDALSPTTTTSKSTPTPATGFENFEDKRYGGGKKVYVHPLVHEHDMLLVEVCLYMSCSLTVPCDSLLLLSQAATLTAGSLTFLECHCL